MSRVIIVSRLFPSYHPRKGEETFFVEKIVKSFMQMDIPIEEIDELDTWDEGCYLACKPKHHTIRAGNRWKVGDKFSPRVWSGKPYRSKQIIIAPDIEIKKIFVFKIKERDILIDGLLYSGAETRIAKNDGLSKKDFLDWFKYPNPFSGQIICWNENINY